MRYIEGGWRPPVVHRHYRWRPVAYSQQKWFLATFGDMPLWNIEWGGVVLRRVFIDIARKHDCLEEDPTFITRHPPNVFARLLPDATTLRLDTLEAEEVAAQITLAVPSTQTRG